MLEHMTNVQPALIREKLVTVGPIRILGLDPGLRRTGWGVIETHGSRLRLIACGTIAVPDDLAFAVRLHQLFAAICAVVAEQAPHEAAVEEVFVNVNPSSTLKLGHARACALIAPAQAGLPVAEYAARLVKKSVVGAGAADKAQVAFMMRRLLPGLDAEGAGADACDALAVAVTHAHLRVSARRTQALQGAA